MASLFLVAGCGALKGSTGNNTCNCNANQDSTASSVLMGENLTKIETVAQSFTVTQPKVITKVALNVSNHGNYAVTLRLNIYNNTPILNSPNTSSIVATSVNTTITAVSPAWANFCFSADCLSTTTSLSANTLYWIAVTRTSDNTNLATNKFFNFFADPGNIYSAGQVKVTTVTAPTIWSNLNGAGTDLSNYDLAFRVGCDSTGVGCD